MDNNVRVRFAPSPTGPLHIGGVRTALYNYLFAKQNGGKLLLRIEDTDRTRFVPGAEEYIQNAFKWLGIPFDEGVGIGGEYGPYKQSERTMYLDYAKQLIDKGRAYYAFDTPEQLNNKRIEAEKEHSTFQYDCKTRLQMQNSLTLSKEKVQELLDSKQPYVIRFLFNQGEKIDFDDLIRGHISVESELLDDKILFKSDGLPTYHLANIVDDHLMKISHVIRGEEWLPSTALHVSLYKAFGWDMPKFAHLPLLLKPDGKGKLSKRDGDRLGFPVFALEWKDPKTGEISSGYKESGYLPNAVINMLALLGWNDGTEQEIFSLEELTQRFSLDRVSKHGAKFDLEKAKWFNHQYLQKQDNSILAQEFLIQLQDMGITTSLDYVQKVVGLIKERCSFSKELWQNSDYLFVRPQNYEPKAIKKRWKDNMTNNIKTIVDNIANINDSTSWAKEAEDFISDFVEKKQLHMGNVFNSLRLAIVGDTKGIDLQTIMQLLGKEEIIDRVQIAIPKIDAQLNVN